MNKLLKIVAILALSCAASFADSGKVDSSNDVTAENVGLAIVDVLFVRPIAAAGTIGGFGLFAASGPFTAMGGVADNAWDVLVERPGKFAFDRDLGDFGN
jgi:hypothetical protein